MKSDLIEITTHTSIEKLTELFHELHHNPLGYHDDLDSDKIVALIETLGLFLDTEQCAKLSKKFEQWGSEE